ncbi:hypothetical protein FHR83_002908 [Actinoplanes campanulatus]|uniref:Uncharacterized protein n=1 Tax=Actinoplanes campanulatus TaxID=113559 RepID=A0A7W5FED4_9ACTN|nr:hypothetical protein [Actinoplanes campanulatus]MBB3095245.1 hypothetical protein [Actinoplanes campanulatus]GGN24398.1 hypothetical protein GCM10010109_39910 [Actinoplanes campanulatus]GID34850.1 hypothetical protein Aca09nite_13560 [Actinoplanes campanulatus]
MLEAFLYLHIVLMVFWLGGDLGVFYSSRYVIDSSLTPAARLTACKIMLGLDLGPKICLILFLPSGLTLISLDAHGGELWGIRLLPWWLLLPVWIGSFAWIRLMWTDHHEPGAHPTVKRVDRAIRIAVVAGMFGMGVFTLVAAEPFGVTTNPKWLGGKVILYALAIAAGLGIRRQLRPFGPAFFGHVMAGTAGDDDEATVKNSVNGCLPYVWVIWGSVLLAGLLGVAKPLANL